MRSEVLEEFAVATVKNTPPPQQNFIDLSSVTSSLYAAAERHFSSSFFPGSSKPQHLQNSPNNLHQNRTFVPYGTILFCDICSNRHKNIPDSPAEVQTSAWRFFYLLEEHAAFGTCSKCTHMVEDDCLCLGTKQIARFRHVWYCVSCHGDVKSNSVRCLPAAQQLRVVTSGYLCTHRSCHVALFVQDSISSCTTNWWTQKQRFEFSCATCRTWLSSSRPDPNPVHCRRPQLPHQRTSTTRPRVPWGEH